MVWDNCLRTIKKNVNPQSFKTWFEPIKPVQLEEDVLTIQVPNKFFFEWLEEHFVQLLKKSIRQELGDRGRLERQEVGMLVRAAGLEQRAGPARCESGDRVVPGIGRV